MKIHFVFHSCFVVEFESCVIVFDYWRDPECVLDKYLCGTKPMYVFPSHFHEDHFCREVFRWRAREGGVTYILSKDILRHRRALRTDADVWMGKGATWSDSLLRVVATGSTDVGVSWVVEVEGYRLFHAGDLNNWYSRFLSDPTSPEVVHSAEFGIDVSPVAEEKKYLGELKDIAKISTVFDVVMFPIDGRIGNGYTRGARQFVSRFKVGLFVPMHFTLAGFESAWRMAPYALEVGAEFWSIGRVGESLEWCRDGEDGR